MSDPVSGAVNTIRDNLTQSWRDWDVSHGDLLENNSTLAALTPAQRNEAISKLSDSELNTWADEVNGTVGSLSASERGTLFNSLAEGLDATQLARVTRAFDGHDGSQVELGKAIGERATSDVKVAYVQAMSSTMTEESVNIDAGFGSSSASFGNPEARAVGEVLASMAKSPSAFNRAINSLSDDQLEAVMEAAAGQTSFTATGVMGGGSTSYDFDPKLLASITTAASYSGNTNVQARVFEAAADQLKEINDTGGLLTPYVGKDADVKQVSDAMTALLRSNPNGIVTELRTNVDPSGAALTQFNGALLDQGKEQTIRDVLVLIQQGPGGNGNAFERFSTPAVARDLGYFSGSVAAAINNQTSDRADQANMLKNVFGAGFGAAGAANPVAGVIASVGNGITAQTIDSIVKDVAEGDKDLKRAMYELAMPRNASGSVNDAGPGYDSFNAAYGAITEVNR